MVVKFAQQLWYVHSLISALDFLKLINNLDW